MSVTNDVIEPTSIGLSEAAHVMLKRLKDDGCFSEMSDAYRFGIALALAHGVIPSEVPSPRTTVFSVATIDPNRELHCAISNLMADLDGPVYRMAERLADWGVRELDRRFAGGDVDLIEMLNELEATSE